MDHVQNGCRTTWTPDAKTFKRKKKERKHKTQVAVSLLLGHTCDKCIHFSLWTAVPHCRMNRTEDVKDYNTCQKWRER